MCHHKHITPMLKKLHWLLIEHWIDNKLHLVTSYRYSIGYSWTQDMQHNPGFLCYPISSWYTIIAMIHHECRGTPRMPWYTTNGVIHHECHDTPWMPWYTTNAMIHHECRDTPWMSWYITNAVIHIEWRDTPWMPWYIMNARINHEQIECHCDPPSSWNPLADCLCWPQIHFSQFEYWFS